MDKNREYLRKFLKAFATGYEANMTVALAPLEKLSRGDLLELLTRLHLIFTRALGRSAGTERLTSKEAEYLSEKCSPRQLYMGDRAITQGISMLQANGSSGHCVGMMMAMMDF